MARVSHRVGIAGEIGKIYRAMHEPAGLDGWWSTRSEGTPEVGQLLHLHFSDVVTLSFRIEVLEENARIGLRCVSGPGPWQDCRLTLSLQQDADQVWVRLEHENTAASEEDFLYFSTKWTCYLLSLRDFIETGRGRPYPNDIKIHLGD